MAAKGTVSCQACQHQMGALMSTVPPQVLSLDRGARNAGVPPMAPVRSALNVKNWALTHSGEGVGNCVSQACFRWTPSQVTTLELAEACDLLTWHADEHEHVVLTGRSLHVEFQHSTASPVPVVALTARARCAVTYSTTSSTAWPPSSRPLSKPAICQPPSPGAPLPAASGHCMYKGSPSISIDRVRARARAWARARARARVRVQGQGQGIH